MPLFSSNTTGGSRNKSLVISCLRKTYRQETTVEGRVKGTGIKVSFRFLCKYFLQNPNQFYSFSLDSFCIKPGYIALCRRFGWLENSQDTARSVCVCIAWSDIGMLSLFVRA